MATQRQRYRITYTVISDYEDQSIDLSQLLEAAQDAASCLQESIGSLGLDATVEDVDGEGTCGDGPSVTEVEE